MIIHYDICNVWLKTILPVCPRDTKRLDTPDLKEATKISLVAQVKNRGASLSLSLKRKKERAVIYKAKWR